MEPPKYRQGPPIPTVALSLRPYFPSPKKPIPPSFIALDGDDANIDDNDLRVMQAEGGNDGRGHHVTQPPPVAPARK
jgi:hypothetical protein